MAHPSWYACTSTVVPQSDIFGSYRCECGDQLHDAMKKIQAEGKGVVVYLNQEGRGIGLMDKIRGL